MLCAVVAGWLRPERSVARASSTPGPVSLGTQSVLQRTQLPGLDSSRSRAYRHRVPPSVLTSTERTGAPPDQERPVSRCLRWAANDAPGASSKALLSV